MHSCIRSIKACIFIFVFSISLSLFAQNQTPTLSTVYPDDELPFRISIELADLQLPNGIHSFVFAEYENKFLILCGRTNGMHGFNNDPNNFPPSTQNPIVYVIDPIKNKVYARSLENTNSGLTQDQIESLSVTSPQFYQSGKMLYITGGYGYRTSIQNFTTFDALTAINIPGLIKWVIRGDSFSKKASRYIRQIFDPVFQVTGGFMDQLKKGEPTLLVMGQDFEGAYFFGTNSQAYTNQIRRFHIIDNGVALSVKVLDPFPVLLPDPNYRRRDLNIVRALGKQTGRLELGLLVLSGVFTELGGMWTVPVSVASDGSAFMANPNDPNTFKQAMNNYASATAGLYSKKTGDMYTIILGGITFGYFNGDTFLTDSELPFTNQVTTVRVDKTGLFKQFYMKGQEYPVMLSTQSNPGNQLLFGAGAAFIPSPITPTFVRNVIDLDKVKDPVIGYIIGGIQSTVPNTSTLSDSAGSPYLFKVSLLSK